MGTVEEVKTKHQMRRDGAAKRERALAYSILQQVTNSLCDIYVSMFSFVSGG